MNSVPDIRGIVCPMVTPFDEQGRIDRDGACELVDFILSKGVHCLMIAGTTGEGMLLDTAERKALCEIVVKHVAGRAPIIAHTGCISTRETVELTRHAASVGTTAASVIVPYFFTLDDDALFDHFVSIAHAVPDFPIFLYAFPGNAKNDISPALLARLLDAAPNIIGIKSSNPDLIRLQEYIHVAGERHARKKEFLVFGGVDGLMFPALMLGAKAQVSGNSNVCPEIFGALYEAYVAGDMEQARFLQAQVNRVRAVLRDGITPAYFKAGLVLRGIRAGRVRPPMPELSPEAWSVVEEGLGALEII